MYYNNIFVPLQNDGEYSFYNKKTPKRTYKQLLVFANAPQKHKNRYNNTNQ